ncbi:MAG TPA: TolC family protein [Pyrinomonadaceae bacterium]|nr:TolC family protein [Pyrinomonadaceae bacterium]
MRLASKKAFASAVVRAAPALAVFVTFGVAVARGAQKSRAVSKNRKAQPATQQAKPTGDPAGDLARLRAQLVQATKDYKSSLEKLLPFYEAGVARADDRASKTKELYEQGLVSKNELEKEEAAASDARAKVEALRESLKRADEQIADVFVEEQAEEAAARTPPKTYARAGGLITTTAYIRYGGTRPWSLAEAGAVEQFFAGRFARQLPISSFGQSPVHDRWGFDHHNAMDVGLSPDSVEGRALMEYLRAGGIPFTAFRYAIPGTATGPHIHVGRPSHRIAPK